MEVQLEKESYTSRELMFLLNMSYMSIYRLIKDGKLHPVRIGNKHLFFKEDIERYIREEQEKKNGRSINKSIIQNGGIRQWRMKKSLKE